jgi:hypothetical protein
MPLLKRFSSIKPSTSVCSGCGSLPESGARISVVQRAALTNAESSWMNCESASSVELNSRALRKPSMTMKRGRLDLIVEAISARKPERPSRMSSW